MGFYPPTENPCVMMRENLNTESCEYIVVYQDDLYIASPMPEDILNILQNKYKININQDIYLGSEYPVDPGGKMICQLRQYLEKLYINVTVLFNDKLSKDQKFPLKIMRILITKDNLTLIHNEITDENLYDYQQKENRQNYTMGVALDYFLMKRHLNDDKQFKFLQDGSNRILSKAQILLVLKSHKLLSTLHVTHQSAYFKYSFHQVELKFERISRIHQLLKKLSSEHNLIFC